MAFDPQNKKIKQALREPENKKDKAKEEKVSLPSYKEKEEKTQNYTFSLQPSVRKKLTVISKEQGFPSASSFINELIKGL
ncbi:hypothetical protein AALM99_06980 [Lactococcus muris]|uniref:CopG family transcriptional regulator n=1 Tax=Lactococcus muris TaxID=2941330 RepID=A0ABV4DC98_9LACT